MFSGRIERDQWSKLVNDAQNIIRKVTKNHTEVQKPKNKHLLWEIVR